VSLFCGSCAVESKIQGFSRVVLNDKHPYLIALLKGVQSGYSLPDSISEEEYQFIRNNKDLVPALTGFVGFGCSFGGKWFGEYARNKGGTNYAAQSKRSLLKDMATLTDAEFICGDYRDMAIPQGAVIYADPPYNNTTGYSGGKFDTAEFWLYMRLLAETGHMVFVSEQEAPPEWVCIWEKPFRRTLDRNKNNQFVVMEKLFTYGGDANGKRLDGQ
jgi:DNA adenine methylase